MRVLAELAFDHVHLAGKDPHAAASWYIDKPGDEVAKSVDPPRRGAEGIEQVRLGELLASCHDQ